MFDVNKKTIFRIFLGAAGCILLYWLLNEHEKVKFVWKGFLDILSPFIIGGGFAFIANVPMRFFENKLKKIETPGLRRAVALVLTFISVAIVLGRVFLLLIPQLVKTVEMFIPAVYDFLLEVEARINSFLAENPETMEFLQTSSGSGSLDICGGSKIV